MKTFKTVDAIGIGMTTLVGVGTSEYPVSRGNCFSVALDGDAMVRVVNMAEENLEELLRRGTVSWPVKVHMLSDSHCAIHDERIPDEWYQERWCRICTPHDLLPINQQLEYERKVTRGAIVRHECENGMVLESQKITASDKPLRLRWSIGAAGDMKNVMMNKDLEVIEPQKGDGDEADTED